MLNKVSRMLVSIVPPSAHCCIVSLIVIWLVPSTSLRTKGSASCYYGLSTMD